MLPCSFAIKNKRNLCYFNSAETFAVYSTFKIELHCILREANCCTFFCFRIIFVDELSITIKIVRQRMTENILLDEFMFPEKFQFFYKKGTNREILVGSYF